ncbi:MAG: serine protease [Verrucomicrobiota bacterium]
MAAAETAEELLERSARAITDAQSFSGRGWGYHAMLSPAPGREAEPAMMQYYYYQLLHRAPQEWMFSRQLARSMRGRYAENNTGESFVYQTADGEQTRGKWQDNGAVVFTEAVPGRADIQSMSREIETVLRTDPGAAMFAFWDNRLEKPLFSWNLTGAILLPEARLGRLAVWRVAARDRLDREVHLWLNRDDLMLVRSVVIERRGGRIASIGEWNYDHVLNPADLADHALRNPRRSPYPAQLSTEVMSLTSPDLLLADFAAPALSDNEAGPALANSRPAPVPRVTTAQKLTPEQMAAIVLIESGDGQASGFLTKLRDVDFVVTNLHVLGDDPQLIVRNLNGEILPVQGIFGAVGRDIAIMRVGAISGDLSPIDDVLGQVKIGDEVVVVGNRQGGRVATQVEGKVLGIGPGRIEVDAPFEPGNSGSPVVHLKTGRVIGVATYSETRQTGDDSSGRSGQAEQRWFAYRFDGITQWEAIDLQKWRQQYRQIQEFYEDTESLYYLSRADLNAGKMNPRIRPYVESFEGRFNRFASNSAGLVNEMQNFLGNLRGRGQTGVRELRSGEFYDYFRSSLYWKTNINDQLEFREWTADRIERMTRNVDGWRAQVRGGHGG